jgi:hypothetical protein
MPSSESRSKSHDKGKEPSKQKADDGQEPKLYISGLEANVNRV